MPKTKKIKSIFLTFIISSSNFQSNLELIFLLKSIIVLIFLLIILNMIFIIPINILFAVNQDEGESKNPNDFDDLEDQEETDDAGDDGGDDDPSIFATALAFLDEYKLYIAYGIVIICGVFIVYDNWDKIQELASYFLPKPDGSNIRHGPTTLPQTLEHRKTFAHPDMNLLSVPENIRRRLRETQLTYQFLDVLAERKIAKLNEETGSFESYSYQIGRQDPKHSWLRHYSTDDYGALLRKAYCNSYFFAIDSRLPRIPGLREAFVNTINVLDNSPAYLGAVTNEDLKMKYGKFSLLCYDLPELVTNWMHKTVNHKAIESREVDVALRAIIEPENKSSVFTKKYYNYRPYPEMRNNPAVLLTNTEGFLLDKYKNMYAASLLITHDEPAGIELIEKLNLDPTQAKKVAQNYIEQMDLIVDRLLNKVTHAKPGYRGLPLCDCKELGAFYEIADIQFGFFSRGLTRQVVENTIVTGQESIYHKQYQEIFEKINKHALTSPHYNFWKKSTNR